MRIYFCPQCRFLAQTSPNHYQWNRLNSDNSLCFRLDVGYQNLNTLIELNRSDAQPMIQSLQNQLCELEAQARNQGHLPFYYLSA